MSCDDNRSIGYTPTMNNATDSFFQKLLSYWSSTENFILAHDELAGLGVIIFLGACLAAICFFLLFLWKAARAAHIAGTAAQIRRGSDIGARILIARGIGSRGGAASEFLSQTARTHLKGFMFGGPFDVIDFPVVIRTQKDAQTLLRQADADLVMWGDGRKVKAPLARIARLEEGSNADAYHHTQIALPKDKTEWTKPLSRALAYAAARELRPALGRPQDFRPERLTPVVETLEDILDDNPQMDAELKGLILDDYSAGVIQLTIANIHNWPDRAVDIMRDTLEKIDRAQAPDRWVRAKINLGRALKLKCEKRFDPIMLQEAVGHLTDALEALRSEPKFKMAETAAQTITDCQKMLGTRRRFSITRGGI